MELKILQVLVLSSTLGLLLYYLIYFSYFLKPISKKKETDSHSFLSIVLCTKNPGASLKRSLECILTQDYRNYELVIVAEELDASFKSYLLTLSQQLFHVRLIEIDDIDSPYSGKKKSLHAGITMAKYDWIVCTDDDVIIESPNWLSTISSSIFTTGADIILGFSPSFVHKKPKFVETWSRYDSMQVASKYYSATYRKKPYMGMGRNMVFKKELWNGDYLKKYNRLSQGDDSTLVQFYKKKGKSVGLMPSPAVYTLSPITFRQWLKNKLRHISTGKQFVFADTIYLMIDPFLSLVFYGSSWYWISYSEFHYSWVVFSLLFIILKFTMSLLIRKRFSESFTSLGFIFFFDFFYQLFLVFLPIVSLIYKPKWK